MSHFRTEDDVGHSFPGDARQLTHLPVYYHQLKHLCLRCLFWQPVKEGLSLLHVSPNPQKMLRESDLHSYVLTEGDFYPKV